MKPKSYIKRKTPLNRHHNKKGEVYKLSRTAIKKKEGAPKYPVKKQTPIKKVSAKLAKELQVYNKARAEKLADDPNCEIKLLGCTIIATDVHHMEGRGKNLCNKKKMKSACRHCHDIITEDSAMAIAEGHSSRRNAADGGTIKGTPIYNKKTGKIIGMAGDHEFASFVQDKIDSVQKDGESVQE